MRKTKRWLAALASLSLGLPALAQDGADQAGSLRPTLTLQALLERVEPRPARSFLIDARAAGQVYLGGTVSGSVSYPVLLSILRANGLAAVEVEGIVNIVPAGQIRSYPVPMIDPDADGIPDDEWVSTILQLRNMNAPQAVPLLRPLMPIEAHLAAMPPSTIMLVDRYANLKRIVGMLRELDRNATPGP